MSSSWPRNPARQGQLEEVLSEYMQRLDRGEAVDREQFLARHPELADELRSYFADSDEVERLGRQARADLPAPPRGPAHGGSGPAHSLCPARGAGPASGRGHAR